jgi:formamidopyrimidine-DNA glycosylase
MPELPDLEVYRCALEARLVATRLEGIRLISPFLLRSVSPPLKEAEGRRVEGVRRLGKRLVLGLEQDLHLVLHLMIAGRLRWKPLGAAPPRRSGLAAFDFTRGTLILTEAGSKKRASLHLVQGSEALAAHDPGGLEPLQVGAAQFHAALVQQRHTLKRALTDPRIFAGIGNAYSDEILWAARLAPFRRRSSLAASETDALYGAMRETLAWAIVELRRLVPPHLEVEQRKFLNVHMKGGEPCPRCGTRITEVKAGGFVTSYCRGCQR